MEIFKEVTNYEGLYQVSALGNVKSLPKGEGNGYKTRILKQERCVKNHTAYRRVTLSKNGKVERFQVHRLVATHFIENPHNKPNVNHIDNNGENNSSINLEWCTHKENMLHSSQQGRQDAVRKNAIKVMCEATKAKAIANYESLIGETFTNLTALSYVIDNTLKRPCAKFTCECTCGNTDIKNYDQLTRGRATMCSMCSRKEAALKRKQTIQDKDIVSTA